MKKVIFSDIDGTLIHKPDKELTFNKELSDLIQINDENRFISKKTIDLISKLRENGAIFVLITGRRKSSYQKLAQIIPHDYAVIEHGCVILENGNYDLEWLKKLEVDYLVVHTQDSEEFYHDFANPEKFEEIPGLKKISEEKGNRIYQVLEY